MPYMVGKKPKTPAGVRRSPSRFAGELPFWPSQAIAGLDAGLQQPARITQSRSAACVEERLRAIAVIS
jgi:hypothetical protein